MILVLSDTFRENDFLYGFYPARLTSQIVASRLVFSNSNSSTKMLLQIQNKELTRKLCYRKDDREMRPIQRLFYHNFVHAYVHYFVRI